jgi:hypothetical protein
MVQAAAMPGRTGGQNPDRGRRPVAEAAGWMLPVAELSGNLCSSQLAPASRSALQFSGVRSVCCTSSSIIPTGRASRSGALLVHPQRRSVPRILAVSLEIVRR